MPWELAFLEWVENSLTTDWLSQIFRVITISGNAGMICWIAAIVMLFFKKWRRCGVAIIIAMVVFAGINQFAIKPLVARERPYLVDDNLQMAKKWFVENGSTNWFLDKIIGIPDGGSFMSGHTLSCFVTATIIFFYHRRTGVITLFIALIMGWTRLYFGVHFPSDVLCGMIIGIIGGFCTVVSTDVVIKRFQQRRNAT